SVDARIRFDVVQPAGVVAGTRQRLDARRARQGIERVDIVGREMRRLDDEIHLAVSDAWRACRRARGRRAAGRRATAAATRAVAPMRPDLPSRPPASTRRGGGRHGRVVEHEIDLARLEVDARDAHADPRAEAPHDAAALAAQLVARGLVAEVVAAELVDMHEPVDVEAVESDEEAEARDTADRAVERLTDAVAHEVALEPRLDVARRVVGAALGLGRVLAELAP